MPILVSSSRVSRHAALGLGPGRDGHGHIHLGWTLNRNMKTYDKWLESNVFSSECGFRLEEETLSGTSNMEPNRTSYIASDQFVTQLSYLQQR